MDKGIEFSPELVARYNHNGPRYTSYPTAAQFSEEFSEGDYIASATTSNKHLIPNSLSVYLHIPFCASPCFYCGCNRIITRQQRLAESYLARLCREIEMQAALFDRDREVVQLHMGGGTPTFLDDRQMTELMESIGRHFNLSDNEQREFSVEVDPRTVHAERVLRLAEIGFNRISIGIQDFDPVVQRAVNRVQSIKDTLELISQAKRLGFRSVGVDLIYGLPLQSREGFTQTLKTVVAAAPDRISLYSYAHMPQLFKAQNQINAAELPEPDVKLSLLRLAIEKLTEAGYIYIGMDHFAQPGDELVEAQQSGSLQRNFQGYSTYGGCDLIGLGMSAISRIGDSFGQNARSLKEYCAAIDCGNLAVFRGVKLSEDDLIRAAVIHQIMCRAEIDFGYFEDRFGVFFGEYFAEELRQLAKLESDGLLKRDKAGFHITPAGRLLLR
ncbi:MAG: oxygen-independent coproporphyrinogen III oxidase, partial [Gammaproteobacteria bacterium]|nr:oxygen-independent coproporphyrinogen III oxidase [Gammaproteobacteria bacterium]